MLLTVIVFVILGNQHRTASKAYCINKLKWVGIGEKSYTDDHGGKYPWMLSSASGGSLEFNENGNQTFRHFQVQSNYIQDCNTIICPQDNRQAAANWEILMNINTSYFVGLDSKPDLPMSIVSGDRNITPSSSIILQASQSVPPSWISSVGLHGNKGHLVFGDGHVEELDSTGLANAIQRTDILTNHFAVP
jgi:prepilin-type processing-associated H-X9-DG protein